VNAVFNGWMDGMAATTSCCCSSVSASLLRSNVGMMELLVVGDNAKYGFRRTIHSERHTVHDNL
jgi:hypothetical protein